jgi:hypothetical protein
VTHLRAASTSLAFGTRTLFDQLELASEKGERATFGARHVSDANLLARERDGALALAAVRLIGARVLPLLSRVRPMLCHWKVEEHVTR